MKKIIGIITIVLGLALMSSCKPEVDLLPAFNIAGETEAIVSVDNLDSHVEYFVVMLGMSYYDWKIEPEAQIVDGGDGFNYAGVDFDEPGNYEITMFYVSEGKVSAVGCKKYTLKVE